MNETIFKATQLSPGVCLLVCASCDSCDSELRWHRTLSVTGSSSRTKVDRDAWTQIAYKKRKQTLIAAVRKNEPLFALQTNGFHLTEKCNIRLHISPGQLAATLCDNYQVIWTQWKMTFLRKLGQGRAQHESVRLLLFWTAEPDQGRLNN